MSVDAFKIMMGTQTSHERSHASVACLRPTVMAACGGARLLMLALDREEDHKIRPRELQSPDENHVHQSDSSCWCDVHCDRSACSIISCSGSRMCCGCLYGTSRTTDWYKDDARKADRSNVEASRR